MITISHYTSGFSNGLASGLGYETINFPNEWKQVSICSYGHKGRTLTETTFSAPDGVYEVPVFYAGDLSTEKSTHTRKYEIRKGLQVIQEPLANLRVTSTLQSIPIYQRMIWLGGEKYMGCGEKMISAKYAENDTLVRLVFGSKNPFKSAYRNDQGDLYYVLK